VTEVPCPKCGGEYIGMDTVYTKGARRFCQSCGAKGPRAPVTWETPHAEQVQLATAAWNQWAGKAQATHN
jgi:hypothetical protein